MNYEILPDFTWHTKISSYDAGQNRRLRLSNQLKLQQEVGELHFGQAGLSYDVFYQKGMAFVLTRAKSKIYRQPSLNEKISIKTWHRNSKGAQFYRCYQFFDEQGEVLIDSVTAFALVDIHEHKLLRPSVFEGFGIFEQPERTNQCLDPCKIKIPDRMKHSGERTVRWSDTDYNGHLNNTIYADIACDVMPGGMSNKCITGFSIAFLHEAKEGDCLTLYTDQEENYSNKRAWIIGDHPNARRCFEAEIDYA